MNITGLYTRKRPGSFSCLLMLLLFVEFASSQENHLINSIFPRHQIGFCLQAGMVPKIGVTNITGTYQMQSKYQSSFSGGFVYKVNLDTNWNICYGLLLNVTSTNYYSNIPAKDLQGFPGNTNVPQIWDKQAYYKLSFPALLSYNFFFTRHWFYSVTAGIRLNYSGFSVDEIITNEIADSNRQLTKIFQGNFTSNNHSKPWLTYFGSLSKTLLSKNRGLFSIGLFVELSNSPYIQGDYEITIPNKPVTEGKLFVKGSSVGISIQYFFPNKKNGVLH